MRTSLRPWLTSLVLGVPLLAAAAPVTFSFDATVAALQSPWSGPAGTALGDQIVVTVSFDSNASPLSVFLPPQGGTRTDFDPASLSISYTAAGTSYTRSVTGPAFGLVRMRDNAPDPDPIYFPEAVDGLTFLINDGVSEQWQLTLRGPTLDLITSGSLPTFQDDRWDNQRTAVFDICRYLGPTSIDCDNGYLRANIVPEPVSLVLVAVALAGVTASRRRRPKSA
jgi:hypothetical protein